MKRPLPIKSGSLTTLTVILLSSSVAIHAKKDDDYLEEPCSTLLSRAIASDADGSGGLSKSEFAKFYNSLDGDNDGNNGENPYQ